MNYWSPVLRAPAGAAAGVQGAVGNPQPIVGYPPSLLPGYLNTIDASYHQQQVAGTFPQAPQVSFQAACESAYLTKLLCDCLITGLLNVQQTTRLPSHISIPYNGIPYKRHTGTGATGTLDPPITLAPSAPGGPYTLIADFTVLGGTTRGVLREIGVTMDPEPSRNLVDIRVRVNNQVVAPFDRQNGAVVGATDGSAWLGFPYSILEPMDTHINLFAGDSVTLEGRNTFGLAPIEVAGMLCGWTYTSTIQTSDRTIRGTLTDQR